MTASATTLREKHDGQLADRGEVRLWLRLLSCAMVVEKRLKRRFADRFGTTLPRFDVLAALDRHPDGMTMGALSRSLLVSAGNVTVLVQALVAEGHVALTPSPTDRRASIVTLTGSGRGYFAELADAHHHWVAEMFGGLSRQQRDALYDLLGAAKLSIGASGEDA
jgi:DNA-binding MarR family transcriptional regulator